jgi:hypothetical protein
MFKSIRNNPKLRAGRIHHVLLQELVAPHTFFSYIFLNRKHYKDQKIPKEVFWHEETHAIQKHSLDILLLELLQIIFWFNPLVYWAKHLVKLNHEFLADQTVINKGAAPNYYQNMLLTFSTSDSYRNATTPTLANAIHYSSIKKRIVIMKTQTSKKAMWLKSVLLLPLMVLLLFSFSSTHIVQKIKLSEQKLPSLSHDSLSGATESMMQEYRAFTDNLKKSETQIIKMPEYQRIEAIYELMTDKQLASVTDYKELVKIPNLNISQTKSIGPSTSLFESWKDSKKYAIWIDGKHVSNTILDQYNSSDIVHFTSSFVYNNARSEKFPQPYQNRLYTSNGFEEAYSKYSVNEYNVLSDQYREEVKSFLKNDQLDNSELRILKVRLDQLYNSFSNVQLEKYSVLAPAPIPITNTGLRLKLGKDQKSILNSKDQNIAVQDIHLLINDWGQILLKDQIVKIEDLKLHLLNYNQQLTKDQREQSVRAILSATKEAPKKLLKEIDATLMDYGVVTINIVENKMPEPQEGASKTEILEFNILAKIYNAQPQEKRVVPLNDLKTLERIYGRMTESQKKSAQAFPECAPPPTHPAPPVKKIRENHAPTPPIAPKALKEDHNNTPTPPTAPPASPNANDQELPPPPPTIATHVNTDNYSKEVKNAIDDYLKKVKNYRAAVSSYHTKQIGSVDQLKKTYAEVMQLYATYKKLAIQENVFVLPVPLYNDPKGEFGKPNTNSHIDQNNFPAQPLESNVKQKPLKKTFRLLWSIIRWTSITTATLPQSLGIYKGFGRKRSHFLYWPTQIHCR